MGRVWFAVAANDRLKYFRNRYLGLSKVFAAVLNQRADATEMEPRPGFGQRFAPQILDGRVAVPRLPASSPHTALVHYLLCRIADPEADLPPFGAYRAVLIQRSRNWTGPTRRASYSVYSYNTSIGRPLKLPARAFLVQ
jgi:hypothetical protein